MKSIPMPSRFVLIAFACVALQTSSAAGGAEVANKKPTALTVTKECGTAVLAGGELDYCTITDSNLPALKGAKIRYFGPGFFAANHLFLDSWVVIESQHGGGGTASGHCLVRGVPDVLGACQFTGGSGSLSGFRADVTVTTLDGTTWYWNGTASTDD
jgi:hypothetical protein